MTTSGRTPRRSARGGRGVRRAAALLAAIHGEQALTRDALLAGEPGIRASLRRADMGLARPGRPPADRQSPSFLSRRQGRGMP